MSSSEAVKLRIVVLDDEPLVLAGVSMLLESLGHQVFQAASGEEVLEALVDGQRFNVGILDLNVRSGRGGQEIVSEVAEIDPDMKLIVTSGYRSDDIMVNCRQFGFQDALPKPFSRNQLSELIDRLFQ